MTKMLLCLKLLTVSFLISAPTATAIAQAVPAALSSKTSAQPSQDDPIAFYRAYEAALARGEIMAASDAAVTAWRTGERVWNGNNPNLPGLAYNAAWTLMLANKVAEALEPATRAIALHAKAPTAYGLEDAQFLQSYAQLKAAGTDLKLPELRAFNAATKAIENSGWPDAILPMSLIAGGRAALEKGQGRLAAEMAQRGLVEAERILPGQSSIKTTLQIIKAQGNLNRTDYKTALNDVIAARDSYGEPRGERDANWAALVAWEGAIRAYAQSVDGRQPRNSAAFDRPQGEQRAEVPFDDPEKDDTRDSTERINPFGCTDFKLTRRGSRGATGIAFPMREASDGLVGGAFVFVRVDAQGNVIEADPLASIPRPAFGQAARRGIMDWKYTVPAGTPARCLVTSAVVMYAF